MTKFPKLRTLTGDENSKNFFSEHNFLMRFFRFILTLTREHAKMNKFFSKMQFFILCTFFPQFLNSTQSEFGRYKKEFKHCKPSIIILLASFTLTVPILIRNWGQSTCKEKQDLHIPKYLHFHHPFSALFLNFFSNTCCKWIF